MNNAQTQIESKINHDSDNTKLSAIEEEASNHIELNTFSDNCNTLHGTFRDKNG